MNLPRAHPIDHREASGSQSAICDLIIPALNEAANIDLLFDALEERVRPLLRRVIVADNGSEDDTALRAAGRGAIVAHEPHRGYGAACLRAIAWIRAHEPRPDVVVFLDADQSDDPADIPGVILPIAAGEADLVIGSRVRLAEPGALALPQRVGNAIACSMIRLLTGARFNDLGPCRAIRWSVLERLEMGDRTWGWTVEMQMKAAMMGYRVREVDVRYRPRRHGRSKISRSFVGAVRAGFRIMFTIARIRFGRS